MSVGGFLCRGFFFGAPFFYDCFCSKKARAADQGTTRYEQRTKIKIKKNRAPKYALVNPTKRPLSVTPEDALPLFGMSFGAGYGGE